MKRPEKLNSALILGNLTTHPVNPVNGMQYYNITDNKFYRYENNSWKDYVESSTLNNYYTKSQVDTLLNAKSNVGHTHPISEVIGLVQALNDLQNKFKYATSTSFVDITNMSLTITDPGEYLVIMDANIRADGTKDTQGETRLVLDGTQVNESVRSYRVYRNKPVTGTETASINGSASHVMVKLTVTANQVIKAQYRNIGSGTMTATQRNLIAIRL